MEKKSLEDDRKCRESEIDLLKIVAMLMICILHFVGKGGFLNSDKDTIQILGYLFKSISIVAVNIYALSSGYLMGNTSFRVRRVIRVWVETLTYSVAIFLICVLTKGYCGLTVTIKSIFPVFAMEYWYISAYIILLLFMPLINSGIQAANKEAIVMAGLTLIAVFSVWHTLFSTNGLLETGSMQGYGIVWMICLYIIGASIKKYRADINFISRKLLLAIYIICCLVIFGMQLNNRNGEMAARYSTFSDYNNFVVFMASISLFIFLLNSKINKINNTRIERCLQVISSPTLAVYLIQEQYQFKEILWTWAAKVCNQNSIALFVVTFLLVVVCVFTFCVIIDIFREKLFAKLRIYEHIEALLASTVGKAYNLGGGRR